jgi:hypothetical protein
MIVMKELGDSYVKSEFRLHLAATPEQVTRFLQEWNQYLLDLNQRCIQRSTTTTTTTSTGTEDGTIQSDANNSSYKIDDDDDDTNGDDIVLFGRDLPPDLPLSKEQFDQLQQFKRKALMQASSLSLSLADRPT